MPSLTRGQARAHRVRHVCATEATLRGHGRIVRDSAEPVTIVTWPQTGRRPIVPGTGNEGGTVEDCFIMERRGEIQHAVNRAVGRSYITGWFADPGTRLGASPAGRHQPDLHPRGQLSSGRRPDLLRPATAAGFVALLAKPGDDVTPDDFHRLSLRWFVRHPHRSQCLAPAGVPARDPERYSTTGKGRVHACVADRFSSANSVATSRCRCGPARLEPGLHVPEHTLTAPRSRCVSWPNRRLSRAAGAPLLGGNSLELLIDAAAHYDAWLRAIRTAPGTACSSRITSSAMTRWATPSSRPSWSVRGSGVMVCRARRLAGVSGPVGARLLGAAACGGRQGSRLQSAAPGRALWLGQPRSSQAAGDRRDSTARCPACASAPNGSAGRSAKCRRGGIREWACAVPSVVQLEAAFVHSWGAAGAALEPLAGAHPHPR